MQLVLEEVLLSDVHLHPYELLGWEGVFGTVFMAAALPVLHVLPGASTGERRPLPRALGRAHIRPNTMPAWRTHPLCDVMARRS